MSDQVATESALRGRANRRGYRVYKSRVRNHHINNYGQYRLVDDRNYVVLGVDFDASLEDIDSYLREVA
jgi:hypothetical protein